MPYADPEEQRRYQRERRARIRAEWFAGKRCNRCGSGRDLHLHHRDPGSKVDHRVWSWSVERRASELAKCDVLCGDCHRALHVDELTQHGTVTRYEKGCRCEPCRRAKSAKRKRERQK